MSDDKPLKGLKKVESLAKIFSLIALPLLVAVGGWYMQSAASKASARSDYIRIAVNILSQPKEADVNDTLREWAAKTVAHYSEIPFNAEEFTKLKRGELLLIPNPPTATPIPDKLMDSEDFSSK